jgi:hypothetical protein
MSVIRIYRHLTGSFLVSELPTILELMAISPFLGTNHD